MTLASMTAAGWSCSEVCEIGKESAVPEGGGLVNADKGRVGFGGLGPRAAEAMLLAVDSGQWLVLIYCRGAVVTTVGRCPVAMLILIVHDQIDVDSRWIPNPSNID
jgi:hypothetical protein